MNQTNMFSFCFKAFFPILIFAVLAKTALSANQQYEACEPKDCGDGLAISYPFWIRDEHQPYCGLSAFQINCIQDKPTLRLSNIEYVVRNISYETHSILVVDSRVLHENCPTPLHNTTVTGDPFRLGTRYVELYFFYNCTSLPTGYFTYPVLCASSPSTSLHSFAAFLHEVGLERLNATTENCQSMVNAPVDVQQDGITYESLVKMSYLDILREGFLLNWPTSDGCRECEASAGHCGFEHNQFVCFCRDRPHRSFCRKDANIGLKVGIGVGTGVGGVLMSILCFILYQRRKKSKFSSSSTLISRELSSNHSNIPDPEKGSIYFKTPIFTYKELDEATNHFDSKKELGDGGFGTVYHGKLRDGRVVAVKRLFEHNYKRVDQFMNEIAILSGLRHRNLVSLYGCTSRHSRELLLVYEYVPNGTVADHLHGDRATACQLTWPIRLTIAIESADALAYLHASQIIHRDVKTNNILLDNGFHVKVADFGLSRLFPENVTHVSTAPQGTPGYVDPEYYQCYQLNDKSDVYSFGVVLIELISSKPAVDIGRHRHEINLANMAVNKIQHQALHELVDLSLGFDSDYNVRDRITLVAELAFRCLQQEKEMRPCMIEVLETLRGIQSEEYKKKKSEEIDTSADARLLKNSPLSPVSVTDKWASRSTTPNTSS